jgi:hypothetical protein
MLLCPGIFPDLVRGRQSVGNKTTTTTPAGKGLAFFHLIGLHGFCTMGLWSSEQRDPSCPPVPLTLFFFPWHMRREMASSRQGPG